MKRYCPAFSGQTFLAMTFSFVLLADPVLRANPVGGQVVAGNAAIEHAGSTLTINQQSQRAIINWQGFSIGHGETTKFVQPSAGAAVLNRVTGGDVSAIYGTLSANGQVWLINSNGVLVGATGVIDTAGFLASTANVGDSAFLAGGDVLFSGASDAGIVNLGRVTALDGDVVLIARRVENSGVLSAPQGSVALAGGTEVLFKPSGTERVFIQPASGGGSVENAGLIEAAAAELKAAGGNEYALAINNTGAVRATGVVNEGGRILLKASTGTVRNSGVLSAAATLAATGAIPEVHVLGDRVELAMTSLIEAGGGFVDTSGQSVFIADGALVDTRTADGRFGTWLVDPTDFYVTAGGGAQTTSGIGATTLSTNLGSTNVTLQTAAGGSEPGDIFVNAAVSWSANTTLTLDAARNITFNAPVTSSGTGATAGLSLKAGNTITATVGALTANLLTLETGSAGGVNIQTAAHNVAKIQTAGGGVGGAGTTFRQTRSSGLEVGAFTSRGTVAITEGSGAINVTGPINTSATSANISLTASDNSLAVNGQINAGSGQVALVVGGTGGMTQADSGAAISAHSLRAEADSGSIYLAATVAGHRNNISVLAGRTNGDFSFVPSGGFTVGQVGSLQGLDVGGILNILVGTVGANLTQASGAAGAINAATLQVYSGGSIILDNALNQVGTLDVGDSTFFGLTPTPGSFTLVNNKSGTFNINTVLAPMGISITNTGNLATTQAISSAGNISLRSTTGTVTLGGTVTSTGNGVTLRSGGALNTGAFLVSAASATTGDVTLISDTSFVTIGAGGVTVGDTLGMQIGAGLTFNVGGAITAPSVTLIADDINIGAAINATGTISFAPVTAGTAWILGGASTITAGVINNTELGFLSSASALNIGRNLSGTTTSGALFLAGPTVGNDTLNLFSSAGITQIGNLILGGGDGALAVSAAQNVTLTGANQIGSISGGTTNGTFNIQAASGSGLSVGAITNAGGAVTITDNSADITVDGPIQTNGQNLTLTTSGGDVVLDNSITALGASVVLAGQNFINNAGNAAIQVTGAGGRWVVYSSDPDDNTFGGLASGNQAIWDTAFGDTLPSAATGNRYVFTIQPTLTFTSTGGTKTYGDSLTASIGGYYSVSGFVDAADYGGVFTQDTLANTTGGAAVASSSGAAAAATVAGGPYTVSLNLGGLTSTTGYTFTKSETGAITVTRRLITVTAGSGSSIYGNTPTNPGISLTSGTFALTDTLSSLGLSNDFAVTGATGVGTTAIAVTGSDANYTITKVDGSWSVTPRAITVTADAGQTKIYGESDPLAYDYTVSGLGLVNGDTLSGELERDAGENVADYAITQGTLTDTNNANYEITFTAGETFAITPRAITVTAGSGSSIYGDATTNPGISLTSGTFGFTDTLDSLGLDNDFAVTGATGVGTSAIAVTGSDANYTITKVDGSWLVTPRAITITADAGQTKIYGESDPLAYTYTVSGLGLVNGDSLAGELDRDAGENVAAYAIKQGTLTDTNNVNYEITFTAGETFAITPRAITVTAGSGSSIYGNATTNPGISLTGGTLGFSDTLDSIGLGNDFAVTGATGVGAYVVAVTGLDANYTITTVDGAWSVTPRALTVMANDLTKVFGTAYVFAGTEFTADNLVNGDEITSAALASAGADATASLVGSPYTITIGGATGAALANYDITYVEGLFTVENDAVASGTAFAQFQSGIAAEIELFGTPVAVNGSGTITYAATQAITGTLLHVSSADVQ